MEKMTYSRVLANNQKDTLHVMEDADEALENLQISFLTDDALNKESKKLAARADKHIEGFLKSIGVKSEGRRFEDVPDIVLTKPSEELTEYGSLRFRTGNIFVHKEKVEKGDIKEKMMRFVGKTISAGHSEDEFYEVFGNSVPKVSDEKLEEKRILVTAIHEIYHFRSTRLRYHSADNDNMRFIWKSGIATAISEGQTGRSEVLKMFNLLNEGITDELALRSADLDSYTEGELVRKKKKAYKANRDFFILLIGAMANKEKVQGKTVLRDWAEVYLNGWTPEFKQRLRSTFGDGVLKRLAYLSKKDMEDWTSSMIDEFEWK